MTHENERSTIRTNVTAQTRQSLHTVLCVKALQGLLHSCWHSPRPFYHHTILVEFPGKSVWGNGVIEQPRKENEKRKEDQQTTTWEIDIPTTSPLEQP